MTATDTYPSRSPKWIKPVAVFAMAFGTLTLISGGGVLFGSEEVQRMAGNYMPFVLWFNFLAGFLYIVAGAGIWMRQSWAANLAVFIAAATGLTALVFGFQVLQGQAYEMRTVGALALRFSVWLAIAVALKRTARAS